MHKRVSQAVTVIMIMAMLIMGCASEASNIGLAKDKERSAVDTGFSVTAVGSYDSADTAVVMSVDMDNSSVTFMNMDTGKQYTLYYNGTTYVTDKHDGPMTVSQLKAGDVVDVNFLKGKRQIASIQLAPDAWVYDNVENYDLGGINKTASIGASTYSLPENVVVLSGGRRTEIMDVVAQDVVTISGVDHKIYSINVEKGHGYLRLKNDQALIGGWIEVGSSVIREITEDMLLVVPEGSYQVLLSNDGISCTKEVVIERDKEVVLDVGDVEIARDKTGRILFSVTPQDAVVTVDGKQIDTEKAVELPYGIHQVHLEAEGYDSLTKYIQVGSENASISFTLEKSKEEEDASDTISQNSIENQSANTDTTADNASTISENTITASSGNKVYIDAPKNVEVYLDSNYVGIAPVSFKKSVGSHTITLRKSGYKTKSYTIYLYNDGEDITYSFTDLEKESDTVSSNSSSSGSTSTTTSDTADEPTEIEADDTVSGNTRYLFE
ncbi:MAG: PEGA domain-containing protein [Lachnospiraceae bacterium]|nr:PEGA domain-containing protein [Lachnospiraceae bacterium]